MSRNKREGGYSGKWQGKHYRSDSTYGMLRYDKRNRRDWDDYLRDIENGALKPAGWML